MSKSKRLSTSQQSNRRSSVNKNILNLPSEDLSKRTSDWWQNLSDKFRHTSILTNSQLHSESYKVLDESSTVPEDQNSDWWKNLPGKGNVQLPSKLSDIVKKGDENLSQSESDENYNWRENIVPKTSIFNSQEQRLRKSRYSRAFTLDKEDRNLEVTKSQDQPEEENKVEKFSKVTKGKKKRRKTKSIFAKLPGKRKYSDAFTVPSTEPEEFKQINEDPLVQKEDSVTENISVTKVSNKEKTKEGLFKPSRKKKKYSEAFLNAFNDKSIEKTPEKELNTEIQADNSNSSNQMKNVSPNISTRSVNLTKGNKSISSTTLKKTAQKVSDKEKTKEGLFKPSRKKKKYSEAFLNAFNDKSIEKTPEKELNTEIQADNSNLSNQMEKVNSNFSTRSVNISKGNKSISSTTLKKTAQKELQIVLTKLNISPTFTKSSEIKEPMNQVPQNIKDHLETTLEKVHIKDVKTKTNSEISNPVINVNEIKDSVFKKNLNDKKNEKVESKLSSHQLTKSQIEYNEGDESSLDEIETQKSLRSSNNKILQFDDNKSYSEKKTEESEDQTKPNSSQQKQQRLFKVQNKSKKFSQAFVNDNITNDEGKEYNKTDTVMPEEIVTRQRKESLDNEKNKNVKYSQAFMELMSIHKTVINERNNVELVVTESDVNKSVANGDKESESIDSQFSSIPSIDISDDIKHPLFRPKGRKSLHFLKSRVESKEQINVPSYERPQHSDEEKAQEINAKRVNRQSTSLTESGISNFFDNSLISSTKLIINSNEESAKKKRNRSRKRSSIYSSSSKKTEENNIHNKDIETEETAKHKIFVSIGQKINSISIIPEVSEGTVNKIHAIEKNKMNTPKNNTPQKNNSNESTEIVTKRKGGRPPKLKTLVAEIEHDLSEKNLKETSVKEKKTTSIISRTRTSSVKTNKSNEKEVEDNNTDTESENDTPKPHKNIESIGIATKGKGGRPQKLKTVVSEKEYGLSEENLKETPEKEKKTTSIINRTRKSSVRTNKSNEKEVEDNRNTDTESENTTENDTPKPSKSVESIGIATKRKGGRPPKLKTAVSEKGYDLSEENLKETPEKEKKTTSIITRTRKYSVKTNNSNEKEVEDNRNSDAESENDTTKPYKSIESMGIATKRKGGRPRKFKTVVSEKEYDLSEENLKETPEKEKKTTSIITRTRKSSVRTNYSNEKEVEDNRNTDTESENDTTKPYKSIESMGIATKRKGGRPRKFKTVVSEKENDSSEDNLKKTSEKEKKTTSIITRTRKSSVKTNNSNEKEVEDNRNSDVESENDTTKPYKSIESMGIATKRKGGRPPKLKTVVSEIENDLSEKILKETPEKEKKTTSIINRTRKSSMRTNKSNEQEVEDNRNTDTESENTTENDTPKPSKSVESIGIATKRKGGRPPKLKTAVSEIRDDLSEKKLKQTPEKEKKTTSIIDRTRKSSVRTNEFNEKEVKDNSNADTEISIKNKTSETRKTSSIDFENKENSLGRDITTKDSQNEIIVQIPEKLTFLNFSTDNEYENISHTQNIDLEFEAELNEGLKLTRNSKLLTPVNKTGKYNFDNIIFKESVNKKNSTINRTKKSSVKSNENDEVDDNRNTQTERSTRNKSSDSVEAKKSSATVSEIINDTLGKELIRKKNSSINKKRKSSMQTNDGTEKEGDNKITETEKPIKKKYSVFQDSEIFEDNLSLSELRQLSMTSNKKPVQKNPSVFEETKNTSATAFKILKNTPEKEITRKSPVRSNKSNEKEVDIRNKKTERSSKTKSLINHEERDLEAELDDQLKFRKKKKLMKHSNKIDNTPLDDDQSNVITIHSSITDRISNNNIKNWLSTQNNQIENRNSEAFPAHLHFGPKSLFAKRHETTPQHIEEENVKRKLLLIKAAKTIPHTKEKKSPLVPEAKITDFFTRLRKDEKLKPIPKKTNNIKKTPRPVCTARLIDGKPYYAKRKKKEKRWGSPDFYKFIEDKIRNKYDDDSTNESENIMKYIENSVKTVIKSKKYMKGEVERLKRELARQGIISTTYDFFWICFDYLPMEYRRLVVPLTQAFTSEPSVPCDPSEVFKKIQF